MLSIQALVNEQLSNDKVDECGTTHKIKRKTPVTLQVHVTKICIITNMW